MNKWKEHTFSNSSKNRTKSAKQLPTHSEEKVPVEEQKSCSKIK